MSLKGYEWLDKDGKVIMYFLFKTRNIYISKDTTREEIEKFKAFLKEHSWEVSQVVYNNYKVQG